jgi:hypothetical protein
VTGLLSAHALVHQLGGPAAVAEAAGVTAQAVSAWCKRDDIPAIHHASLFRLAHTRDANWIPATMRASLLFTLGGARVTPDFRASLAGQLRQVSAGYAHAGQLHPAHQMDRLADAVVTFPLQAEERAA